MITAAEIMAGALPKTRRVFNVKNIGEMELYRLSIAQTRIGQKLCSQAQEKALEESESEELEQHILNSVYFMLHGEYDKDKAQALKELMDNDQIGNIYNTGLFYIDFTNEQTEKNLQSNPS